MRVNTQTNTYHFTLRRYFECCYLKMISRGIYFFMILASLTFPMSLHAHYNNKGTNRLIVSESGTLLAAYYNNKYSIIKKGVDYFYGYGWIDDHRIFVAYQDPDTGAASAIVEIYDCAQNTSTKVTHVGDAGETNFDINPITGKIIYNDVDGIHVMHISDDNKYKIKLLKSGQFFWGVFWINEYTIGAFEYKMNGGGESEFTKINLPKQ